MVKYLIEIICNINEMSTLCGWITFLVSHSHFISSALTSLKVVTVGESVRTTVCDFLHRDVWGCSWADYQCVMSSGVDCNGSLLYLPRSIWRDLLFWGNWDSNVPPSLWLSILNVSKYTRYKLHTDTVMVNWVLKEKKDYH